MSRALLAMITVGCLNPLPALAQDEVLSGMAAVHNADIISIDGQRVILWGVDAPEPGQLCRTGSGQWNCYEAAKRSLETLAGRGEVNCTLVGEPDPYGRRYGVCETAGEDIGAELVRQGMALAHLEQAADYEDEQLQATEEGVGLWQAGVTFMEPWVYRSINNDSDLR